MKNKSIMKKKFTNFVKTAGGALLLLVLMLVGVTQAKAQETYGLKIAGVEVTSENCNDLSVISGVSGTVKYDPATKTLTLDSAKILGLQSYCIENNNISGLVINATGENYVGSRFISIAIYQPTTITGGGTINTGESANTGIKIQKASLLIDSCTVNAQGKQCGISGADGASGTETLIIRNAKVTAKSEGHGSIYNLGALTLDSCIITTPEGAAFDESLYAVAQNGEIVKSEVVIEKIEEPTVSYGLKIAGIDVTNKNCNDLSVISGVSGTVKYDPATKTLTLDSAKILGLQSYCIENNNISGLVINATGENYVGSRFISIAIYQPTTITGGGTINTGESANTGIKIQKASLLIDSCTVNAQGKQCGISGADGASGTETLIIRNAKVTAKSEGHGSIYNLGALTLDSCIITTPEGAAFDESLYAVAQNGEIVKSEVVIEKIEEPTVSYGLKIAGIDVTNKNCNDLSVIEGVEGTAKYDPETKTLFLEDVTISSFSSCINNSAIDGLTINATGENFLVSSMSTALYLEDPTIIKGSGNIIAASNLIYGIYFKNSLEIDSCTVNAQGLNGIAGDNGTVETLTIRDAKVTSYGQKKSICDIASLILDGSKISTPAGAAFDDTLKAVALNGQTVSGEVVIDKDVTVNYGLQLAGIDVTNKNCNDLSVIDGVSGSAKYEPETKTLYLENVTITNEGNGIDNDTIDGLTINVTGENRITTAYTAINLNYNPTIIKGNGILYAESNESPGIYFRESLEIDSCTVNAKGTYGITGDLGESETLTIRNATVKAAGPEGSVCDIASIAFDGCFIKQPAGAAFDETLHSIALNGQTVTDTVAIEKVVNYGMQINKVNVTNENCNDLSVIPGVSGTAKYDPETKTLFLENATITTDRDNKGIDNDTIYGLTINVTGENSITTKGAALILNYNPTTIKGGGTLNIVSNTLASIFFKKSLEIDSCTVNAKGKWGIAGENGASETLIMNNANVTAEGTKGSICDILSLTLDYCSITQPDGAAFDESVKAVALNGETVTSKVIIKSDQAVGIKDVKTSVSARKQGIYSIDGVYLGTDFDSLPKGIYIKDGKKVLK